MQTRLNAELERSECPVYSSDFHEGRQYFITLLILVLNFAFTQFLDLTINMQLLYLLLRPAKFIQPSTINVQGTVLYRASSYYCDQPSPFSQAPSACGVQCSTKHLVLFVLVFQNIVKKYFNGVAQWRREYHPAISYVLL